MAKKSLIQREHKRKKLEEKSRLIRQSLKKKSKDSSLGQREIIEIQIKLQSLPRNSAPTRLHRRCLFTGRPRANYQHFTRVGEPEPTQPHCFLFNSSSLLYLVFFSSFYAVCLASTYLRERWMLHGKHMHEATGRREASPIEVRYFRLISRYSEDYVRMREYLIQKSQ